MDKLKKDFLEYQYGEIRKQAKKEVYLTIIKDKFNGSVRDFLIWYGGNFKDIDIDLEGER